MKVFKLYAGSDRASFLRAIDVYLETLPEGHDYKVQITEAKEARSLEQLNGLFGNWLAYIAKDQGYERDYLHRWMKSACLARIYIENPQNAAQAQWCELLAKYQESGELDKLERHAKRISLKWISDVNQMSLYMNRVEQFWAEQGVILPPMEKNHRRRKAA